MTSKCQQLVVIGASVHLDHGNCLCGFSEVSKLRRWMLM